MCPVSIIGVHLTHRRVFIVSVPVCVSSPRLLNMWMLFYQETSAAAAAVFVFLLPHIFLLCASVGDVGVFGNQLPSIVPLTLVGNSLHLSLSRFLFPFLSLSLSWYS